MAGKGTDSVDTPVYDATESGDSEDSVTYIVTLDGERIPRTEYEVPDVDETEIVTLDGETIPRTDYREVTD